MANRPAYVWTGSDWDTIADPGAVRNSLVQAKADLVTATGNATPARLAVGTNGYVLTANSATSTGLEWGTGVPILQGAATNNVNVATVDVSLTSLTSLPGAPGLMIYVSGFASASNNVVPLMQVSSDGGATFVTTGYYWAGQTHLSNTTTSDISGTNDSSVRLGTGTSTAGGNRGMMQIYLRTFEKCMGWVISTEAPETSPYGQMARRNFVSFNTNVTDVNAVRFLYSSGNVENLWYRIYSV